MAPKYFLLMLCMQNVLSLPYNSYGGRYYPATSPRRQSSYVPISANSRRAEYPVGDYDEGYIPGEQLDFDYYDKYDPYVKYGEESLVPVYQSKGYYPEQKPSRNNWEAMNYYDDPQDSMDAEVDDAYGGSSWFDDPVNAESARNFINNLVLAEALNKVRYNAENDDYDETLYDYMTYPAERLTDKEKLRRYLQQSYQNQLFEPSDQAEDMGFKNLKAKNVKAKNAQTKVHKMKGKETTETPKSVNAKVERPAQTQKEMSQAQNNFKLQKHLIANSRKPNAEPVAEGLRLEKKRTNQSMNKYFDFQPFSDESNTNSIKKFNIIKENVMVEEIPATSTTAVPPLTTTALPLTKGQKEVVLPRPSNPARKPEVSTRSMNPPSVYDAIKKLLDLKKEAENKNKTQPQKRFVSTDDPLTAELIELKKG